MNNDSFSHDGNTQFALSYELLHLLKWLEQHDIEKLKKIISIFIIGNISTNCFYVFILIF